MVNAFDILKERGYVGQTVYEEDLYKVLGSEKIPFYVGLTLPRTVFISGITYL